MFSQQNNFYCDLLSGVNLIKKIKAPNKSENVKANRNSISEKYLEYLSNVDCYLMPFAQHCISKKLMRLILFYVTLMWSGHILTLVLGKSKKIYQTKYFFLLIIFSYFEFYLNCYHYKLYKKSKHETGTWT